MVERITWASARRIALRAQGFGRPRRDTMSGRRASREALRRTLERTRLLQIDSVSVFARAHLMPVYSRRGPWDVDVLASAAAPGPHRLVQECLAHEAAFATADVHDLLAFRRDRVAHESWSAVRRAARTDPAVLREVLDAVERSAPVTATALARMLGDDQRGEGWGWRRTQTQWVVDFLFRSGRLECVGRTPQFERLFVPATGAADSLAGASGTGPAHHAARPPDQAILGLVRIAADALGIATVQDLADYFRLPVRAAQDAVATLLREGTLTDVEVARPHGAVTMLRHCDAPGASPVRVGALLSPFDPMIFHRPRLQSLFDVEYRLGIYTPLERRTHGYYALPFLLGDRILARTDLRADRARGVLEVRETHREPLAHLGRTVRAVSEDELAACLTEELRRAARWQGLAAIEVHPRGDLAPALADVAAGPVDVGALDDGALDGLPSAPVSASSTPSRRSRSRR